MQDFFQWTHCNSQSAGQGNLRCGNCLWLKERKTAWNMMKQMMRRDTQQHVTTPAEGIPGNLLPGRRSFGESTSSPKHQHATSLSAATAACLQHYKQTVKQRLGCIERLFYSSDAQLVVDRHCSGLALVMSALCTFFFCFYLLSFCFTFNKHQIPVIRQLFWSHWPFCVLHRTNDA